MINVTRGERPKSLDRPEIKEYIDQVVVYNALPNGTKATAKKPDAGKYRDWDVLEAFDRDFYSKCYLTEQKFANSWAMDIEHFKSKAFGQSPELKYEWSNLYPCSHDANMLKQKNEPSGGYLDPCKDEEDVEKEIVYSLEFGGKSYFDALNPQNIKAKNTAELLTKLHNGIDKDSKQKTATLRLLINKRADEVTKLIMAWLAAGKNKSQEQEVRLGRQIKEILSRKSDFTMLLRSLACIQYLPEDFLD
jgi:hypothetical protein